MTTVTDKTYTFTGLTAATSYDFEVLAINDQGTAPDNHAAELATSTASGGMQILVLIIYTKLNYRLFVIISVYKFLKFLGK